MTCVRCESADVTKTGWCQPCELAYDAWSRRHASDIIVQVLGGAAVVMAVGVGMPLLGISWLVATTAAAAGWSVIFGTHRAMRYHRRRQFLAGSIPRAYLPAAK